MSMSGSRITVCCIITCVAAVFWHYMRSPSSHEVRCWKDYLENEKYCSPSCPNGSFALAGMSECHKWLTCEDQVLVKTVIVTSVVKTVYLANWEGFSIVVSELTSIEFADDFHEHLKMLLMLGPTSYTVKFLGYCNYSIYTQFHKLGSALNFRRHLTHMLSTYNTITLRFHFCLSYASIIRFLHSEEVGVRVMCDSSALEKTLSQYLITDDLKLVLNDMDALPKVGGRGVVCGSRQLNGTFVAPEQLWSDDSQPFQVDQMHPYDEKTDIWKMPEVCNWFLGSDTDSDILKFKLFKVHKRCKNVDPAERPSADFVLKAYEEIWSQL